LLSANKSALNSSVRRIPPQTYMLTPRLDVLECEQYEALTAAGSHHDILAEEQAAVLYTVITSGRLPTDVGFAPQRSYVAARLRQTGLIHDDRLTGGIRASDDVLFSLRLASDRADPLPST
jgi:hypothetical protein